MGAEISMNSNKMVNVKTRKDCTEEKYLDLYWRGANENKFINNKNKTATKYYKTQFKEICTIDYHNTHIPVESVYFGNIIPNVGRFE